MFGRIGGLVCSFLLMLGCTEQGEEVGTAAGEVSVTWTNAVGVSAGGNDLTKTSGTTGWNAGAVSVETVLGDGFVEFTTGEANTSKMAGLSVGDSGQGRADIDFAIQLTASGAVGVYEAGILKGATFTSYLPGDLLRVEANAGVVRYSKNGAVFYTSLVAPGSPLGVDTSLNTPGATLLDVELVSTSIHWQNLVAVSAAGDDLSKTGTDAAWSAGASSVETLTGDGFVEFTATEATTLRMAGLGIGDASAHFSDIELGIRLKANGVVGIYEAGAERVLNAGTYLPGDTFRVEVSGGVVTYRMNGGPPLYTSQVAPTFPLRVDTSFHTPGATLTDVRLVEDAAACPAYQGDGPVCDGTFVVNNAFDLAEIAGCAHITGNLTVDAPGMTVIALPALERVGGTFTVIGNPELQRLRLPQLKDVGGTFTMTLAPATTGVDLSRLRTGGALSLTTPAVTLGLDCLDSAASLLASANAPRLRTVAGDISGRLTAATLETVGGSVAASPFVAPMLTEVGGVLDYGSETHTPSLQLTHDLHIHDTPSLDLPVLVEVTGELIPVEFSLTIVDLPSLQRAGSVYVGWQGLEEIHLPSLQEIGPSASGIGLSVAATIPTTFSALTIVRGRLGGQNASFPVMTLVDGDLYAEEDLDFPALTSVNGDLYVFEPLTFPVLALVTGRVGAIAPIDAPALAEVGGDLETALIDDSSDSDFSALTLVKGALLLSHPISAPALETVKGDISIGLYAGVATLSLPSLTHCRAMLTGPYGAALTTLELPALATVSGPGPGRGVIDIRDSQLTTLSMPSLQTTIGKLNIQQNEQLTSIDFPQLTSIGPLLRIRRNQALPTCQAENLRDQLVAAGWTGSVDISGNDNDGTCP